MLWYLLAIPAIFLLIAAGYIVIGARNVKRNRRRLLR
jgi:hypothetical protein